MMCSCNKRECYETKKDRVIVKEENKKKIVLKNQREVLVTVGQVDGCIDESQENKKCDYLFEYLNEVQESCVIYCELKGSKIGKALEQILSTVRCCRQRHKNYTKIAAIVHSRYPQEDSQMQRLRRALSKEGISKLEKKAYVLEISL